MSPQQAKKMADDVADWLAHSSLAVAAFRILLVFSAFAFWSAYSGAMRKIDEIPNLQSAQEQFRAMMEYRTADRFTGTQGAALEKRIDRLEFRMDRLERRPKQEN